MVFLQVYAFILKCQPRFSYGEEKQLGFACIQKSRLNVWLIPWDTHNSSNGDVSFPSLLGSTFVSKSHHDLPPQQPCQIFVKLHLPPVFSLPQTKKWGCDSNVSAIGLYNGTTSFLLLNISFLLWITFLVVSVGFSDLLVGSWGQNFN